MADYGLLKGIGDGISAGLDTYMAMKKMKHDQRISEMTHGIRENPETGEMEYTPEKLLQQQTEILDKKNKNEFEFLKAQADARAKGLIINKGPNGYSIEKDPSFVDQDKLYKNMQMQKLNQELSQGPKFTEGQEGAATFAQRVMDSNEQIKGLLSDKSYDPSSAGTMLQRTNYMPELVKNENVKLMEQAERNFVNAVLRKESGASISPTEFSSAEKQYFPRPGDTPYVLAQKERNREVAIAGLRSAAGGAFEKMSGLLPKAQATKKQDQNGLLKELGGKTKAAQKPKKVIQNGHTYILNEQTGEYE